MTNNTNFLEKLLDGEKVKGDKIMYVQYIPIDEKQNYTL